MDAPPPPPPPHGANPNTTEGTPKYRKSTDLPEGQYDIFVIPPHSAGSGFVYLPSLQCHRNSFIAGSLSTLLIVAIWTFLQPVVKNWVTTTNSTGGMGVVGVMILVLAVGFAGWYFGSIQNDGGSASGSSANRPRPGSGFGHGFQYGAYQNQNGNYQNGGPPPNGGGPTPNAHFNADGQYNPGGGSQPPPFNNHNAQAGNNTQNNAQSNAQYNTKSSTPKDDPKKAEEEWEKAREETRRKEEIRRKMEAYKRKREAEEAEKRRQKEREAMEEELRRRKAELEREAAAAKAAAEKEIRERAEREAAEREEQARREQAEREERARREQAEREEKAKKEAEAKEAAAKEAAKKEAAARFAAAKEAAAKKFAAAKEAAAKAKQTPPAPASAPSAAPPRTPSPRKPPPPSARTAEEDDSYSFRPYDRPRRPYGTSSPSVYSESSYAPSQSTARTTPPPSQRAPYTTKDPDKIIICGVYLFNNAFQKTPIAQLVSGQGTVTDGLILKITTAGLFIDDDVRGIAQREWDVKAWTLKSVESVELRGLQIVRVSIRDQEGKKYVFILGQSEVWKVKQGLLKLKRGSQVRALSQSELPKNEGNTILTNLGYA